MTFLSFIKKAKSSCFIRIAISWCWRRFWCLIPTGFRNTNSQISSSLTANGKYVVAASEDSNVYVWKHEGDSRPNRSKGVTVTRSYEHFHCQDVSVAIPWPGTDNMWGLQDICSGEQNVFGNHLDEVYTANHPPTPVEDGNENSPAASACTHSPLHGTMSSATNSYFFDRISATWPEEKLLLATKNRSPHVSIDFSEGVTQNRSAWGMVIVTAGLRGEIRIFQNFGLPVRIWGDEEKNSPDARALGKGVSMLQICSLLFLLCWQMCIEILGEIVILASSISCFHVLARFGCGK